MRHLLLIRHAKSSWENTDLDDHQRPLNQRGQRDALTMAKRMSTRAAAIEAVCSSTAIRALGIAESIADELDIPLIANEGLYTFSADTLQQQLCSLPNQYRTLAVVSHNPAITAIASRLIGHDIDNIPTAAMVGINCQIQHWHELCATRCHLAYTDSPKNNLTLVDSQLES